MNLGMVIAIFWCIILLTHVCLIIKHLKWSRQIFPDLPKRPTVAKINGISLNIRESVEDINDFIHRFNKHNHQVNIAQLWGYVASFLAALIGLILSIQLI